VRHKVILARSCDRIAGVSPGSVVLLVLAGVVAGALGTAGGITSLVSYPTLLAVGLPPYTANVTNLVAAVACWPASAAVSTREVGERRGWLRRGLPAAAVGGIAGAALFLTTSAAVFEGVVPVLVALASVALLAAPWLTTAALRESRSRGRPGPGALALVALVSVYGGYFGAGSGVMLLAAALVLVDGRLPVANAVKNMLVGAGTLAAAVLLAAHGPVDWAAAAALGAGILVGSPLGPVVVRRVPAWVVRWGVGLLGLGLAAYLAFSA
jgi:hypothetical protein